LARTDYYLLNDPDLSFKEVIKLSLVDDPATFLREKFAESFKSELKAIEEKTKDVSVSGDHDIKIKEEKGDKLVTDESSDKPVKEEEDLEKVKEEPVEKMDVDASVNENSIPKETVEKTSSLVESTEENLAMATGDVKDDSKEDISLGNS